ncbi:MAG: hypothetical protein JXB15_06320 [Anaerolineales bacterium]|nr:hypothetical protein [Anaerolineales bacterium]
MFLKIVNLRSHFLIAVFASLIVLFSLAACHAAATGSPTAALTATQGVATGEPPTPTSIASSPTPTLPPARAILLAPPGADASLVQTLQAELTDLSAQAGLLFERREQVTAAELGPQVQILVALPPDTGLAELAAASPQTQFLAVGIGGLQAAQNLSLVAAQGERPDRQGFLAGYLATVITDDWRVGVISLADNPAGRAARQAFTNGVIFYCGLCRPVYPPFYEYPLYVEIPGGASQADQQAAADILINSAVKTVYVVPGAGDENLLAYLASLGINIIGGMTPPDVAKGQWVASIQVDILDAVRQVWMEILDGKGGLSREASLHLADINPALLSPGRQRLVETILAELTADYIDTGVDPLTGEMK